MSALAGINSVVDDVFVEYGEDARYQTQNGEVRQIKVIRFDPYQRQDITGEGIATVDPSFWVRFSEVSNPVRMDQITDADGTVHTVRDVEPRKLRGYARLHLSN